MHPKSDPKRRNGLAVVELATTLPIFVMILFGTIETASMIFLQQSLEITAFQGARVALISSSDSTKVTNICNQVLSNRKVNSAAISISPSDYQLQPYGTLITVRVTAPCDSNSPFSPWFYGGKSLTGEVVVMKEM